MRDAWAAGTATSSPSITTTRSTNISVCATSVRPMTSARCRNMKFSGADAEAMLNRMVTRDVSEDRRETGSPTVSGVPTKVA